MHLANPASYLVLSFPKIVTSGSKKTRWRWPICKHQGFRTANGECQDLDVLRTVGRCVFSPRCGAVDQLVTVADDKHWRARACLLIQCVLCGSCPVGNLVENAPGIQSGQVDSKRLRRLCGKGDELFKSFKSPLNPKSPLSNGSAHWLFRGHCKNWSDTGEVQSVPLLD